MAETYIKNGLVYIGRAFERRTLRVDGGRLTVLDAEAGSSDGEIFDASGLRVAPGFIDIHSHGAVGVDVNGASADDLERVSCFMAEHGTTSWLCSVLTDTREQTELCIESFSAHRATEGRGAELLGIHLEGPFLAKQYKGAMPEHLLKTGDVSLVRRYQELARGGVRYITVSPEVDGAVDMIPELKEMGIAVGIGHSGATYDEAMLAIERGATIGTHVGNAMRLFHQHEPAIFGALMESDACCEAICDGRHLAPGSVKMYAKCKGMGRLIAISDSIMATGLPDGSYHLGVNAVIVKDGDARLAADGTRAGSTLTQDIALKNLLKWLPNTLEEILPMLTENPARAIGAWDRKGSIEDGKDADLVMLDGEANVVHAFVRGKQAK